MTELNGSIFALANPGAFVLDKKTLKETRRISNASWLGGHFLRADGETLWLNANVLDSLLQIDLDGTVLRRVCIRSNPLLRAALDLPYHPVVDRDVRRLSEGDLSRFKGSPVKIDSLHLNSLQALNGRMLLGSCTKRALFEISPEPRIIFQEPSLRQPHDFRIVGDRIVVNNSALAACHIYSLDGHLIDALPMPYSPGHNQKAYMGYTRGLLVLNPTTIIIGFAPFSLVEIDIEKGQMGDVLTLHDDPHHTCHGLSPCLEAA